MKIVNEQKKKSLSLSTSHPNTVKWAKECFVLENPKHKQQNGAQLSDEQANVYDNDDKHAQSMKKKYLQTYNNAPNSGMLHNGAVICCTMLQYHH